jgi:hypothetical protein
MKLPAAVVSSYSLNLRVLKLGAPALGLLKLSAWSYLLLENETDSNYGLMTLLSWRK